MMKSTFFLLPALLSSICVLSAPAPLPEANPAPWIVTQYLEVSVAYTIAERTRFSTVIPASVVGFTSTVTPTGTPTNALKTVTDSTFWAAVTVIQIHLPLGSTPEETSSSSVYDDSYLRTSYLVPVTYKPYATCTSSFPSQTFAYSTNLPISLPYLVRPILTPLTVLASTTIYTGYNDELTPYTSTLAILNPSDIPSDIFSSLSSLYEPSLLSACYTPTTRCTTRTLQAGNILPPTCKPTFAYDSGSRSTSTSTPYDTGSGFRDHNSSAFQYAGIINMLIILAFPLFWIILFTLLGVLESYLSFKGLMLGKQRKRGAPYAWCCITCFSLCCVGPTYKAKSAEEQVILGERWKAYKKRERLRLWMKWGFRWKYPDVLGVEPEIDRRALRERCL